MERIRIETTPAYDVWIGPGLIDRVGERLLDITPPCLAAVIADDTVSALYGGRVVRSLEAAGFSAALWAFPHGETQKNLSTLSDALEWLAGVGVTRSDIVVALGGGVTGDLAGFASAVYCRGTRFIQVPTTLLSAVDASVGGKTAVDLRAGKNLAGVFHQPALVLCDTQALRDLPPALIRDGCAEMIKHAMLADEGLFHSLRDGSWRERMAETVARNVRIKRDYVLADERDTGRRFFLNLGHTFGHAAEICSGFSLSHGQSVGMGLMMAARAAGMETAALEKTLAACGLSAACPYSAPALARAALSDKKRRGGSVTLVLPERIGKCYLKTVDIAELPAYFAKGTGESACK